MNKMPQTPAVHISQLTRFNLEKGIGLGVHSSESRRLPSDAQSVDVTTGVFAVHQCAADQLGCADDRLANSSSDSGRKSIIRGAHHTVPAEIAMRSTISTGLAPAVCQITAVENQVGRGLLQIRQDCFKRRSISMDVG